MEHVENTIRRQAAATQPWMRCFGLGLLQCIFFCSNIDTPSLAISVSQIWLNI